MDALGRTAVEAAWFAYAQATPSPQRWVWCPASSSPIRQVPSTSSSSITILFEHVYVQNGHWMVNKAGEIRRISMIGSFVNLFRAEWAATRPNFGGVRPWGNNFRNIYSGVMRKDIEFLARIQETGLIPSTAAELVPAPASISNQIENQNSPNSSTSLPSNPIFKEAAQEQQALFNDPRLLHLLDNYKKVQDAMAGDNKRVETHLERLSQQALYIFGSGRPAEPWLVGMSEEMMKEKDYLLLTEHEHLQMSRKGALEFPVVIRDQEFRQRRKGTSRDDFFRKMELVPGKKVDIQDLSLSVTSPSALTVDISQVISRWRRPTAPFSNQNPPLNLLNISSKSSGVVPLAVTKDYTVLEDACMYTWGSHIGKLHLQTTAADMTNCMQFKILAQRGAVSGFHMDNCGVTTWVTMEALSNEIEGNDSDSVKYWFIVPTHRLPSQERTQIRKDFAKYGSDWRPDLSCKLPSISLITGDTLIMPPGTVHAPITLTDCFFVGGMCMHPRTLKKTMKVWQYLCRNKDCTNEDPPTQARAVLDYIYNLVHKSPSDHGYNNDELDSFDRQCEEVSRGLKLKYECTTGCERRCGCASIGQRCGPRCHQGVPCQNPCGQRKSYLQS